MTQIRRPQSPTSTPGLTAMQPARPVGLESPAVKAFKAKLSQAALHVLNQNEARILERKKALKDTNPSNPAWSALHEIAQTNAHIEGAWSALANSITDQVIALSGAPIAAAYRNPRFKLRLSDQRDSMLRSAYLGWSRTHPQPNTPGMPTVESTQKYLAQFEVVSASLQAQFASIARVEDARDYLRAQYPEVAALSGQMGAEALAKTKNTKAGNTQLNNQLNGEYEKVQAAIGKLKAKIQGGNLPIEHMDVLVQQVLQREGINPDATNPNSQAVLKWLNSQTSRDIWTDAVLALAAVGFTVAAVLAPEFVLPAVGVLVAGGTLTTRNYLSSQEQLGVSGTQSMGGQALSSVSPEKAKLRVVLAQVDALLLAGGVAGVMASSVSKLGPLAKGTQALADSGGYRWAEGAVRTGPFKADVAAPRTRAALDSLEDKRVELGLKPFAVDVDMPRSTVAVVEVNGQAFISTEFRANEA